MPKITKKSKPIMFIIILFISVLVLTWCQDDVNIQENNETIIHQTDVEQTPLLGGEDRERLQEKQQLVIHNGCIWCGRCVLIAPQNFTMEWKIAEIYSQDNINNQKVNTAINNCPVSVIEIIEA